MYFHLNILQNIMQCWITDWSLDLLSFHHFVPPLRLDPKEQGKDDKREDNDEADYKVPDQLRSLLG